MLTACLVAAVLVLSTSARSAEAPAPATESYNYDSPAASTTTPDNVRTAALRSTVTAARFSHLSTAPPASPLAAKGGGDVGRTFVTTSRGTTFDIPKGWVGREADNGVGIVYQRPEAPGNAESIRIMEPTADYPNGYFRYYSSEGRGQPLDVNGKPGSPAATHDHEHYVGPGSKGRRRVKRVVDVAARR